MTMLCMTACHIIITHTESFGAFFFGSFHIRNSEQLNKNKHSFVVCRRKGLSPWNLQNHTHTPSISDPNLSYPFVCFSPLLFVEAIGSRSPYSGIKFPFSTRVVRDWSRARFEYLFDLNWNRLSFLRPKYESLLFRDALEVRNGSCCFHSFGSSAQRVTRTRTREHAMPL